MCGMGQIVNLVQNNLGMIRFEVVRGWCSKWLRAQIGFQLGGSRGNQGHGELSQFERNDMKC